MTARDAEARWTLPAHPTISALQQAGGLIALLGLTWLLAGARWLRKGGPGWLTLSLAAKTVAAGLFWIFRNPQRHPPSGRHLVLAPADGRVAAIVQVQETRFLHGPAWRIDIQPSLGDVQVNRAAITGHVAYRLRQLGQPGSSTDGRDSNWLGLEQARAALLDGEPAFQRVLLRQVAGDIWRRLPPHALRTILCFPDLEDRVMAGEVIGHLPLGKRLEIYLPASAQVLLEPGSKVRAGESVLALLKE